MDDVLIVAALRTRVGKFGGTIGKIPATERDAKVIAALIAKFKMVRRDAKKGLASLCIGGGMGVALAIERE